MYACMHFELHSSLKSWLADPIFNSEVSNMTLIFRVDNMFGSEQLNIIICHITYGILFAQQIVEYVKV